MQAVVLAAGRGTRLGSLTARRSKAMLPVTGQPLVGRVIERLRAAGDRDLVVVGGPDDQELAEYCKEQSYVIQTERRGMAHAEAGCRVGEGAVLRDAVVLRGSVVPRGAEITDAVWAEPGVVPLTNQAHPR
jgi:NDP-sugar pyrophosphorylase family protein